MIDKIGLSADHAGYEMKEFVKELLLSQGFEVEDFGCPSAERCDYPDYAHPLGLAIEQGRLNRGISFCGSGNGISMVLNKYSRVRAALCWTEELARLSRAHNDANILSIPARFVSKQDTEDMVQVFLNTPFDGGRHEERVKKIPIEH